MAGTFGTSTQPWIIFDGAGALLKATESAGNSSYGNHRIKQHIGAQAPKVGMRKLAGVAQIGWIWANTELVNAGVANIAHQCPEIEFGVNQSL